jgi:hypothetical protein
MLYPKLMSRTNDHMEMGVGPDPTLFYLNLHRFGILLSKLIAM